MVAVFVGGPSHGRAREVGEPAPSIDLYERTRVLVQPGGPAFAIYRMPDDRDGPLSPFEALVSESGGRFGNHVKIDATDPSAARITVGDRAGEAVTGSDVHVGALEVARALGWPRPRQPALV
jgi:hypothetical protein